MKLFRLGLVLMIFLLVGCDDFGPSNGKQEEQLYVVQETIQNQKFYLEDLDLSVIQLHFIDEDGNKEIVHLEEDMVVSDPPQQTGGHIVHVQYRGQNLSFYIHIDPIPMISCQMIVELYDLTRDRWHGQWLGRWFDVPEGEPCTIQELPEPQVIQGYTFSHFSHEVGDDITHDPTVYAYYEPITLEVNFYDHDGELLETREILYEDSIHDPPGGEAFPEYYTFYGWMGGSLDNIRESIDFHPSGHIQTHPVYFYDIDGNLIEYQSVRSGQDAVPPEVPEEIDGYIHVGWSEPLEDIRHYLEIHAVYERAFTLSDTLDELFTDDNFTIEGHWQNTPIGDYVNTMKFYENKIFMDVLNQDHVYYVFETDIVYEISQHQDNDGTWYKYEVPEGLLPDFKDYMLIDVLSMDEAMFSYTDGKYNLASSDFDELFQGDISEINRVTLEIDEEGMHFQVHWHHGETTDVFVYDIGETVVELPEYVEE